MEVKRINKGDDVVENFTRNKILEMSDSLKRLAAIYGRWNFGGIIKISCQSLRIPLKNNGYAA